MTSRLKEQIENTKIALEASYRASKQFIEFESFESFLIYNCYINAKTQLTMSSDLGEAFSKIADLEEKIKNLEKENILLKSENS